MMYVLESLPGEQNLTSVRRKGWYNQENKTKQNKEEQTRNKQGNGVDIIKDTNKQANDGSVPVNIACSSNMAWSGV